jgi:hypothetical protein
MDVRVGGKELVRGVSQCSELYILVFNRIQIIVEDDFLWQREGVQTGLEQALVVEARRSISCVNNSHGLVMPLSRLKLVDITLSYRLVSSDAWNVKYLA